MKRLIPFLALAAAVVPGRAAPAPNPQVALKTSKGTIVIEVYKNDQPITAGNFLDLVKRGFYKNMVFHRVVPGFVIQTGDPLGTGEGGFIDPKTGAERTIKLEINHKFSHNAAGVVAMARTPEPNSASSQFYITLAPTTQLDAGYAIFGKVVKGLDVVKRIERGDKFESATILPAPKPAPAKSGKAAPAKAKPRKSASR